MGRPQDWNRSSHSRRPRPEDSGKIFQNSSQSPLTQRFEREQKKTDEDSLPAGQEPDSQPGKKGQRKPGFPYVRPKPAGDLKPPVSPEKPGPVQQVKPPRKEDRPGPPQVRPGPARVKPRPTQEKPEAQPGSKPDSPQVKPRPTQDRPEPPPGKGKDSRPEKKPERSDFRNHDRKSPPFPWHDRHDYRSSRRYRGSSHFHPLFPRYYYDSWFILRESTYYPTARIPEQVRVQMAGGSSLEFDLEENLTTGYQWFASYDAFFCRIDIEHQQKTAGMFQRMTGNPGVAAVQIEAINPGSTMVEFLYTRPWDLERGFEPAKRIQVFLEISP